MSTHMPVHPRLTHPLTGAPIVAVGFRKDGRAIWPIMGGDPSNDDPDGGGDPKDSGDGGDPGKSDDGADKGFPAGTPVAEMTAEQQVAYWKDKAQKHEGRNTGLLKVTGGKYGDDLKAELDELAKFREAQMTDAEKAVSKARQDGLAEAQTAFAPKLARLAFETALSHIEDDGERSALIDALNLTSVITESGDVDTAKVRTIAQRIAPTDKGAGTRRHDYGGGRRGSGAAPTGVKAGADLFAASRNKSTTNS